MDENGLKGGLDDELHAARIDEAAARRRREHWLAERQAAERNVADVLRACTGATVVIGMADGVEHRGQVGVVGADAMELTTGPAQLVVALRHVVVVRTDGPPGRVAARGDWTLLEALADLVGTGRTVRISATGAHAVVGEVVSVGSTVTVRTPSGNAYVATDQVVAVAG